MASAAECTTAGVLPIDSIARHFLSSLLWQFTPMRITLAMADSDVPNIGRSPRYIGVDPKR